MTKARQVIRVTNPEVLTMPDVHGLFQRSFATGKLDADWSFETAMEMIEWIKNPDVGVFFGYEGAQLASLMICTLPTSRLLPNPAVYWFYNEGTRWLGKQMMNTAVAFFKAHGYNRAWTINRTGKSDSAHARLVKSVAREAPVGSIMEIEF